MNNYRYLDDIATADIAFEAWGNTPEELFRAAAEAVISIMIDNPGSIESVRDIDVRLVSGDMEMLLFRFIGEIIFYKDAESLLLRPTDIVIKEDSDGLSLEAALAGEPIDPEKHDMIVDVKAVTLHRFAVEKTADGYRATVVLDV